MDVVRTEVDGVPTFWAPGGGDGALRAGLVFRVGRADETLTRGGITHLIEHLALHELDHTGNTFNGQTGPVITTFATVGGPDELLAFFASVCRALREPPVGRLAQEKTVLRTERRSRRSATTAPLLIWRYGPATYGLPAYDEFGLDALTAQDVQDWTARWFTRGNAAFWLVGGEPPAGLRLELPDGHRMAPPKPSAALPRTPAFFTHDLDGVALDAIVPRAMAAGVFTEAFKRRLWATLRRAQGISYITEAVYDPRDGDFGTVTALVDALPDKRAAVTGGFVDVLTDMVIDPLPEDELRTLVASRMEQMTGPGLAASLAPSAAFNTLLGSPVHTPAEVRELLANVSVEDVRTVAGQVLDSALVMVPNGQSVGRAGFVAAPAWSADAVTGAVFAPVRSDSERRLVVGSHGVSVRAGRHAATVRYAECVGMLAWPDGARALYGPDGITIHIEPQLWNLPDRMRDAIDVAVPADRIARMAQRPADAIPQPPAHAAATQSAQASPTGGRSGAAASPWRYVPLIVVALALAVLLAVAGRPDGAVLPLAALVVGLLTRFARNRRSRTPDRKE